MKPLNSEDTTIIRFLVETAAKYGELDAMRYLKRGEYVNILWDEVLDVTKALSLGLQSLGIKKGGRVALMSKTRYEWRLVDYGILFAGGVVVTIYPSLTSAQVEYIINDSESSIIVVDKPRNLKKVLKVRDKCPNLEYILCISPFPDELKSDSVFGLDELVEKGGRYERTNIVPSSKEAAEIVRKRKKLLKKIRKSHKDKEIKEGIEQLHGLNAEYAELTKDPFITRYLSIQKEDLCTIVYTSGTTGVPKGALLSHHNMGYNAMQTLEIMPLEQHDISLSFLPLSHVLERQCGQFMATLKGFCVAYARDTDSIIENLDQVNPTFMVSVPRLYEKLYDRIIADILEESDEEEKSTKEKIFDNACDWGWEYQKTRQEVNRGREY
ncbi:MAG: AMP-binding protein, partial [Candidatus Lokiarchaeota archaeon]|nr:AMP-binding protein [Candidatus Lokiarchaeota archaeon]